MPPVEKDPQNPVDLNAGDRHRQNVEASTAASRGRIPFVHPAVTDPRAIGHALGTAARAAQRESEANLSPDIKSSLPPKYRIPVAGGAPPAIPALEAEAVRGRPMSEQAIASRAPSDSSAVREAMRQHADRAGSIISGAPGAPQAPAQRPRPLLLLPTDTLSPEATKDPHFRAGAGSMLAQLQPHLAQKYGIVRRGQHISPQELAAMADGGAPSAPAAGGDPRNRPARPPDQVARDLRAAIDAQQGAGRPPPRPAEIYDDNLPPPADLPRSDQEAERQAAHGPGGAAARTGRPPAPSVLRSEEENAEDEAAIKEALSNMGDLDVAALRREMIRDVLKNPQQREVVEARLKPFGPEDLATLIETNRLRQRVPIVPGIFEPTFETMDQDVEFHLKQLLMLESNSVNVTSAYLLDKYAVMTTTVGTVAINNNPLPPIFDAKGDFNNELFWKKFNWMLKRPLHMLASLGIHYAWFEGRARKLFKVEEIKNG